MKLISVDTKPSKYGTAKLANKLKSVDTKPLERKTAKLVNK